MSVKVKMPEACLMAWSRAAESWREDAMASKMVEAGKAAGGGGVSGVVRDWC